ncbi:ArsI/CadI family heavy metal resistance metalloenzyme [Thalassobacillus pellis]|uniref:ArsI/CadI family heavy metal resistance metalloenzyme n=1 Tax=Thalassobacillus pellis TaxID=748008 RepID=UPI0019616D1D|nr:ArsI/CadI family heavy metal resistance metalloenzyme [Thalassobacillus pellis]MBM7553082.1 lactoylglutathione lyase [Thalassobacillus pellis]
MRTHIGLNVTDLTSSIAFYTKLFNKEPVKTEKDYAKFLPDHLALNFTLNLKITVKGNQVGHFGIQVEEEQDLLNQKERLKKLGFFARDEMDTNCCYALQDKFWITDPDGNEWEFFLTKQDNLTEHGACCASGKGGSEQ